MAMKPGKSEIKNTHQREWLSSALVQGVHVGVINPEESFFVPGETESTLDFLSVSLTGVPIDLL
jgi:hypothetical protein